MSKKRLRCPDCQAILNLGAATLRSGQVECPNCDKVLRFSPEKAEPDVPVIAPAKEEPVPVLRPVTDPVPIVGGKSDPQTFPAGQDTSSTRSAVIWLSAIAALLALSIGGYWLYSNSKQPYTNKSDIAFSPAPSTEEATAAQPPTREEKQKSLLQDQERLMRESRRELEKSRELEKQKEQQDKKAIEEESPFIVVSDDPPKNDLPATESSTNVSQPTEEQFVSKRSNRTGEIPQNELDELCEKIGSDNMGEKMSALSRLRNQKDHEPNEQVAKVLIDSLKTRQGFVASGIIDRWVPPSMAADVLAALPEMHSSSYRRVVQFLLKHHPPETIETLLSLVGEPRTKSAILSPLEDLGTEIEPEMIAFIKKDDNVTNTAFYSWFRKSGTKDSLKVLERLKKKLSGAELMHLEMLLRSMRERLK